MSRGIGLSETGAESRPRAKETILPPFLREMLRIARAITWAATGAAILAIAVAGTSWAEIPPAEQALLSALLPGAESFAPFAGDPPVATGYREGRPAGYVFHSRDVVQSVGYGGKPLDVVIGLGLDGRIKGARIAEHSEPIFVIGVEERALAAFTERYKDLDIRAPVRIVRRGEGEGELDAVSGATVSSAVINDAILGAARAVARAKGIIARTGPRMLDRFAPKSWAALEAEGALASLQLTAGEAGRALAARGGALYPEGGGPRDTDAIFITLYAGLATPASIGRNLLGSRAHARARAEIAAGDHLLFIGGRGLYSFKGTAFARTGRFERIRLVQGATIIALETRAHTRIDRLAAGDAPALREMGLFHLPADSGFDPFAPFRLELLVTAPRRGENGTATASFPLSYVLPRTYIAEASEPAGEEAEPLWVRRWTENRFEIGILGAALAGLTTLLVFQDGLARHSRLYTIVRFGFLSFTLVWIGWYSGAQLSVVNVLTFADALRTEFQWAFFLVDPALFILWSYVAVTLLFWGRGVFCGWLCPFGALQEFLARIAEIFRIPQIRVPFSLNERLWPIKYVIFIGLFGLSLGAMATAQTIAEVEPFKTAIVLKFARAWPFVAYALGLLAAGLFIERFFCRYLCPLGAALAIPARARMFPWLKRRRQCGAQCHICEPRCPVQAIHPNGEINPNECVYCLACQKIMYDVETCPPLIRRHRRLAQYRAGQRAAGNPGAGDDPGEPAAKQ